MGQVESAKLCLPPLQGGAGQPESSFRRESGQNTVWISECVDSTAEGDERSDTQAGAGGEAPSVR